MTPYKFKPYLKSTIWGGERLAPFKGIATDQLQVGESWEISGVAGHESVVAERGLANDPDVGKTLDALIAEYKGRLVGEAVYAKYGKVFPLLVKFIDSKQDLSVQVHPDDALAAQRHGCAGKTEMWYVLNADPGAKILAGLRKELTPETYERLSAEDRPALVDAIACHEAHDGDLYFIPAGRLHAIGAGTFLAEIQQTSDITYRVYDYDRRDAQGNLRQLHVAEAKDAIDYRVFPSYRKSYDTTKARAELVDCPYFHVERLLVNGTVKVDPKVDSFVIVICLSGRATVNGLPVRQGETILVPAEANVLDITGEAAFLTAVVR